MVCFGSVGVWRVLKIKRTSNGWSGKGDHNMKGGECRSKEVKHPKTLCLLLLLFVICQHFRWIRQTRGAEELGGGYIQGSREQKRSCIRMESVLERVRQKGKVNLCCHGNWHGCEEQTRINLFTLKEQQGRGGEGHLKRKSHESDESRCVRGLIAVVIWPCDPLLLFLLTTFFPSVLHLRVRFHHFTGSEELIKAEKNVAEEWIRFHDNTQQSCSFA